MSKILTATLAVAALASSAWAVEIPPPNGSFETGLPVTNNFGAPDNWDPVSWEGGFSGAVVGPTYAGFTAQNGGRMMLLDNRPAIAGNPAGPSLQMSFPMTLFRMPYLNFYWVFLTSDPASTIAANRDLFRVTVNYYNASGGYIGSDAPTILTTGALTSVGTVNIAQPDPWGGATLNAYSEKPGVMTGGIVYLGNTTAHSVQFSFSLLNTAASITSPGFSGVLIDNVYINPEPGTLALFGLGAAGLGGLVWKRRRNRKPQA